MPVITPQPCAIRKPNKLIGSWGERVSPFATGVLGDKQMLLMSPPGEEFYGHLSSMMGSIPLEP